MKMRMYIGRVWNLWDTLAIVLFAVGVVLRCFPTYIKDAQLVYVIDVVLWNMRILEILSVNQYLGPYVKIIAKLVRGSSTCSLLAKRGEKETRERKDMLNNEKGLLLLQF